MNRPDESPFDGPAPAQVGPGLVLVIVATCVFVVAVSWYVAHRSGPVSKPRSTKAPAQEAQPERGGIASLRFAP